MFSPRPATPFCWEVGVLVRAVADALALRFNPVTVRGEVSGFARAASGHCYFQLKDSHGQLRCAMFRRAAQLSGLNWRDGLQVEISGRLDVYGPRGDLQLVVETARSAGLGHLYEQFLRLRDELEREGLFAAARKRPLPAFPRSLGVVTSLHTAALRDVLITLSRRAPHLPVTVFPAPVQGEAAPAALCQAVEAACACYQQTGGPEVLLLVRGGGSIEDLWAFNHPDLVRLLARCPMPIITGVGHETDVTLVDGVADVRAATPTAAAEQCAPDRAALLDRLQGLADQLERAMDLVLSRQHERLDRLAQRCGRPSEGVQRAAQRLVTVADRLTWQTTQQLAQYERQQQRLSDALGGALQRRLNQWQQHQDRLQTQLNALDPAGVLQRGYAWLSDRTGHAVTAVAQVAPGEALTAHLADGQLELTVDRAESRTVSYNPAL